MYKNILIVFLVIVFPILSYADSDKLYFKEDGRTWVYAGKTKVGEKTYIPENQNAEDWTEAIIFHHINAKNIPLDVYYDSFMSILNEKSGNLFHSTIIEQTDDSLIFEWWTDPKEGGGQHGFIKVSKFPLGLQFFRYTTKKMEGIDTAKETWTKILKEYDFTVIPEKVAVNVDFSLDGRQWNLAESSKTNQEYLPKGESPNDWTEKFTIDVFPLNDISPFEFYYQKIHDLEGATGKNVDTKVLDSGPDFITFEWKVEDGKRPHWSYYKMTVLDPVLGSGMQYSTKLDDKGKATAVKDVWEKIMKKANVGLSYDYRLKSDANTNVSPESNSIN